MQAEALLKIGGILERLSKDISELKLSDKKNKIKNIPNKKKSSSKKKKSVRKKSKKKNVKKKCNRVHSNK